MIRALSVALLLLAGAARADVPPTPAFEGPITEGGDMYPGLRPEAPGTTAADFGYATDEYFVSGTANGQPYKTRILVRHPVPAERFSGIVVAESMHSNGFAVTFEPARKYFFLRGHVHVEIAAQQSNVNTTLKGFNPVRYASLSIPSGAQTSEIIAQVGVLIKSNLSNGPLAPLSARRLFLEGTSQASAVLRTYQQQKHFQARMADGCADHGRLPRDEHARQRADDDRRRPDRAHADHDGGEQRRGRAAQRSAARTATTRPTATACTRWRGWRTPTRARRRPTCRTHARCR